jgi:hypothetical protein
VHPHEIAAETCAGLAANASGLDQHARYSSFASLRTARRTRTSTRARHARSPHGFDRLSTARPSRQAGHRTHNVYPVKSYSITVNLLDEAIRFARGLNLKLIDGVRLQRLMTEVSTPAPTGPVEQCPPRRRHKRRTARWSARYAVGRWCAGQQRGVLLQVEPSGAAEPIPVRHSCSGTCSAVVVCLWRSARIRREHEH